MESMLGAVGEALQDLSCPHCRNPVVAYLEVDPEVINPSERVL